MPRSASPMVKLDSHTHAKLQSIAREEGRTMDEVIGTLLEKYERERFRKGVAEDLERFQADTVAYQRYLDEFREWDNVPDALGDEPPYYDDEPKN